MLDYTLPIENMIIHVYNSNWILKLWFTILTISPIIDSRSKLVGMILYNVLPGGVNLGICAGGQLPIGVHRFPLLPDG